MDSKILGDRLRQIRLQLRLTQKQLAMAAGVTQSAISRLENGEEVYATVLLSVLHYYQGKISLDNLFAMDFRVDEEHLLCKSREEFRRKILRHLDIMADMINEAKESYLSQIALIKKIP